MSRTALLAMALVLLLVPTPCSHAQSTAVAWGDRGDRFEGIKPRPVGGERFDFVGVRVASALAGKTDKLVLSVPRGCSIGTDGRVDVREDEAYYWMTPKDTAKSTLTKAGFSWNAAEVLDPAGIPLDKLRVTVRDETTGVYCPGYLAGNENAAPPTIDYVFSFQTPADVIVDWQVIALDTGAVVATGADVEGDRRGCEITWRPETGKAPGVYQLRVDGRGQSADGGFKIAKSIDFLHEPSWR